MLEGVLEFLVCLDLVSSRTNHVEASSVSEIVYGFVSKLNVVSAVNPVRSIQESEELGVYVLSFYIIIDTYNDIMAAWGLASRKNDSYTQGSLNFILVML